MRIACVGGGPGGLFFAALVKQARPAAEVVVYERNRVDDTFGFGVVFSDSTLGNLGIADASLRWRLEERGEYWDRIEVRLQGERWSCGGNGMVAITRRELLALLYQRAIEVGVDVRSQREIRSLADVGEADLIVASDGANSSLRGELAACFEPHLEVAKAKFIWLGTTYRFTGLTFLFEQNDDGAFAVHGYPIDQGTSTFIVETDEASWRRAGLDTFDVSQPPGVSDERSRAYLQALFAQQIDGHRLLVNNSRWGNFRTLRNRRWRAGRVVLLGDAAHTAHFSVGSGTKMAMEDAAALAEHVLSDPDHVEAALDAYEASRRPSVDRIQAAAEPSLSWWEQFGHYYATLPPPQFAFHFLTRAITHDRLARRDPTFVGAVHEWWRDCHDGAEPLASRFNLNSVGPVPRVAAIEGDMSEIAVARFFGGPSLSLRSTPPRVGNGPWGLVVCAPQRMADLDAARVTMAAGLSARPVMVAVAGGRPVTRSLLCEHARLTHGLPAMLIEDPVDHDRALTTILSGRADCVGSSRRTLATWAGA